MIADMISRLKTQCPALGSRVEGPTEVGALERTVYPIAIVYPVSDAMDASASYLSATRSYTVQLTVSDWTTLEPLIASVAAALNGYKPDGAITPCSLSSGKLTGIQGAVVQWAMQIQHRVCL